MGGGSVFRINKGNEKSQKPRMTENLSELSYTICLS